MKTLIAVLLVASVAAEQKREAEPSYGLHYPLTYPYGVGLGSAYGLNPYGTHSFLSTRSHVLHKRDAEADPGYLLGGGLGLGNAYGYGLTYGLGQGYGYGYPLGHVSYHAAGHSIGKREAEPGFAPGLLSHGASYGYTPSLFYPGIAHSYQYNRAFSPLIYG
ncbi:glycine-rich protein-like [Penaeus chinensis]|uniref:glycine-rich protein-like n=1 Tax=Penaeus chinensis TaxID=139456 RepID=UPI001FB69888|nr:glycine-rich protein-like [Penaeus chinensis]